ncbi:MAG: ribose-phosphate pyrophosphokinase [Eubacteriales bacterium]|nr:ribose-phosphate pyrophosphokinase [Eubacteriales bacterium]
MGNREIVKNIPIAPLKIAAHVSAASLGEEVNSYLVEERKRAYELLNENQKDSLLLRGFNPDTFLVNHSCPRFGTGEAKAVVNESMRGVDEFIIADITNCSNTYQINGYTNHMSPDDIYSDLKRIIGATVSRAHRVNVIMPFLYESRQHKRAKRESLDCANALHELIDMGVKNIITFDAHDPRVQNSIPLSGFDNFMPTYNFVKALLKRYPDIEFSKDSMMIISPDEGAMDRSVYLANNLGVDMGMFYKRRDYSKVVNGRNPIVAHEFLGNSVKGKTVIIVDDMISSGESMLDTAMELKERQAGRVIVLCTFGLFTNGFEKFDEFYEKGFIDCIITTNLNYKPMEIYTKKWYEEANCSRYLAEIIDNFNHDISMSSITEGTNRIQGLLQKKKEDSQQKLFSC